MKLRYFHASWPSKWEMVVEQKQNLWNWELGCGNFFEENY